MNMTYLSLLYKRFEEITNKEGEVLDMTMEKKIFSQNLKKFLLNVGISSKIIYEHVIKLSLSGSLNFEQFVESFLQILSGKKKQEVKLKFHFLLMLFPHKTTDEYLTEKEINKFFDLIECNLTYQNELCDELAERLILRFSALYNKDEEENIARGRYKFRKMAIALESFFENFNE